MDRSTGDGSGVREVSLETLKRWCSRVRTLGQNNAGGSFTCKKAPIPGTIWHQPSYDTIRRKAMRFVLTTSLFLVLSVAASPGYAQTSGVRSRTRAFLDAYAQGDSKTILDSVDAKTTVYGSDAAEFFRGSAAVGTMLANDSHLWAGTAHIGEMQDVSVFKARNLQTIFFQAPFTVGGRPPVIVRFCMVWKRSAGRWHVLQSSNAVVTQGQSSEQLLLGMHGK